MKITLKKIHEKFEFFVTALMLVACFGGLAYLYIELFVLCLIDALKKL